MKVVANGLEFEVEDSASINPLDADLQARPVVVLIMGLGMQLIAWPQQFVDDLVDAGYRVIRFDNRDIGLSSHLDHLGRPRIVWEVLKHRLGLRNRSAYSLADMAADTLGILDTLGIKRAHIVGVSMGGMIAQRVAIAAPHRVTSLTSIMSSSGARKLPQPDKAIVKLLTRRPAGAGMEAIAAQSVKLFQAIGSPAYPTPEEELMERVQAGLARSFHPVGMLRQMVAVVADHDRAEALARIQSPTLVIHGDSDPLVPPEHGVDTANRIPGARLVTIEGMGHDLPPEPVNQILNALVPHLQQAQRKVHA
ncbi:alpha/beta fold hydrolase [Curvibacter sp. APW13]|uniref:alpha/beta fold hydrolase n=1 Tax=Curvibacter sp. APW13 TaxID=3077236 RepID=UPI0028DDC9FA|nr:alpha/beta fold hydrolase [Curvibacter sp. APW13]MDT8991132.1 alpha/beta fold hydrolase [Curvibacter sp. APW13]